jgi:putative ABC transport system substrate-binding protein
MGLKPFLLVLTLVLAAGSPTLAQVDRGRTPVVGLLLGGEPSLYLAEFSQALGKLGWVDGKTVRLEVRTAEGRHDRVPPLAADLVRLKVDVIAALLGTPQALAAKYATSTIPIVFATLGDPVEFGIVSNLARPERNLTGVGGTVSLNYKRLQLIKEAIPGAKSVAFLTNIQNPIQGQLIKAADAAAQQLGLTLHEVRVQESVASLDSALSTVRRQRANAMAIQGDAFFVSHKGRILDFAASARLPVVYPNRLYADAGGLMSLAPDSAAIVRRTAAYVDRILRGAKPSDLPVEEATKFELVINRKTAKALRLTIPPSLLLRADHIIE